MNINKLKPDCYILKCKSLLNTPLGTVFSLHTIIKINVMKKIVLSLMVATTFAACNSKSDLNTNKDVILTDTSSMYRSNMMTDTGSVIETSALTTGTSTAVANRRATNTNRATTYPTRRNNTNRNYGNTSRSSNSGSSNSGNTVPQRKTGWSKAAKGAVIGGVGGAVVGGVVKGGKGAVVGGVVGAAGGYILGRSKDKKDGRVR